MFLLKDIKGFFAGVNKTKELSPDSICKAPLMLKSDSFWFTRFFIFVAGSLWALFGCEVACLGETSGFGRLSDSRYVLIPSLLMTFCGLS